MKREPLFRAPAMRYTSSWAVAEAYGSICICLSVKDQCIAFNHACAAGIVFG